MNRRDFLQGSLTASAATLFGQTGVEATADPAEARPAGQSSPRFTLQMRFTGLFMFEIWNTSHKKMMVSFVDPHLTKVHEPHVALMIVRLTDPCTYKWPEEYEEQPDVEDGKPLHAPQIVRIGSEVYGVWGVEDRAVWVKSSPTSQFDDDNASSFEFAENQGEWKGLDQFVDMKDVLGDPVPPIKKELIKTKIVITRGVATGEVPLTRCERDRLYAIKKGSSESWQYRKYAAEFTVSHEIEGSEVTLGVQTRFRNGSLFSRHAVVTLRGGPGSTVPLSFMNVPTAQFTKQSHFIAFSHACGVGKNPIDLDPKEGKGCQAVVSPWASPPSVLLSAVPDMVPPGAMAAHAGRDRAVMISRDMLVPGKRKANPPYAGCVPPKIRRG